MSYGLEGVRVLDLTSDIAGPFCTKVLAGLGAEVIKLESPDGGDPSRDYGSFLRDEPNPETSALFLDLNMGKKSVTLNLHSRQGIRIVKALAQEADILVEDLKPGQASDLGIGYADLEPANPRLVYTSITGYGQTGPYRDYQGTDMVIFATGGEMCSTGEPDRPPVRVANHITKTQAGNMAAAATLMTLRGVRSTGVGQHLDVSTFETAVGSVDRRLQHLICYAYNGRVATRADNIAASYPAGVYPCKDGHFHIAGGGSRFFPRTVAMMGMPELLEDPRFSSTEALLDSAMKDEFDTIFVPWVVEKTRAELIEAAQAHKVYASPLLTPEDVYHDPHFAFRDYFQPVNHAIAGRHLYPGAPAKMTGMSWRMGPAPLLGEHNREILAQRLGFSPADMVRLRRARVI